MPEGYKFGIGKIRCCLDCEERHIGCHADCPKYLAESEELEKARKARDAMYNKDMESISNARYYKKLKKGRYKK